MIVSSTGIEGLLLIEPTVHRDRRGYFFEPFNARKFQEATDLHPDFVQDNESMSDKGILRGLHFQVPPAAQGKLVRVTRGAVLDLVVDLRVGSPTFGRHLSVVLSEANKLQLWIPPGFAHGFLTLENHTIFSYKCTEYYTPACERVIAYNDPHLGIDWGVDDPIVSEKDAAGTPFAAFESPFTFNLAE